MDNSASNMKHMNHLKDVQALDLATLRSKEATYQGSWKAAGGRSAWFMARRNMDRLLQMMSAPKVPSEFAGQSIYGITEEVVCAVQNARPLSHDLLTGTEYLRDLVRAEDIFAKIEEHPEGKDGTVLACVRDLRCYLTLVEAEMMSRGVVVSDLLPPKFKTDGGGKIVLEPKINLEQAAERRVPRFTTVKRPDWEYTDADPKERCPDWDGKLCHSLTHMCATCPDRSLPNPPAPRTNAFDVGNGRIEEGELVCYKSPEGLEIAVKVITILQDGEAVIDRGVHGYATVKWRWLSKLPTTTKPATPEDGGQHGSTAPWIVNAGYFERKDVSVDLRQKFWNLRAPGLHVLEPWVASETMPRVLRDFYNMRGDTWTLKIERVPADVRDYFPDLLREQNMKEWEELPQWQQVLYTWSDEGNKYVLAEQNTAWHVEAE